MSEPRPAPPLSRISPLRLFGLLFLFIVACGYAIVHSSRFQRESRALVVRAASVALGRDVSFQYVGFTIVPPALTVSGVRIAGAPGEARPFLSADEISVSGRIAFIGRTLTIGSISALRPEIHVLVRRDGSNNLPPGLRRSGRRSPIRVEIGRIAARGGTFLFNEQRVPLDLELRAFAAELNSAGPRNQFRGRLGCRFVSLSLPNALRMPVSIGAAFQLGGGRLHVDRLDLSGPFGNLAASGEIPDLSDPRISAVVRGRVSAGAVETIFRERLPFRGDADVDATISAARGGSFRIAGLARIPRLEAQNFVFTDVAASFVARPEGVRARISRAMFEGGNAAGIFQIGPFARKPQTFELSLRGERLSAEKFFADIGLPGTGLAGAAGLDLSLRWSGGDLARANGGAELRFTPSSETSPEEVALSGGGVASIKDGFIDFRAAAFRFPQTTLRLSGGFAIDEWSPRLKFRIESGDLRVVDHLATNFASAIQKSPAPSFGLAGRGWIEGTLSGTWAEPNAAVRLSLEDATWANVRFGSVFGDVTVADETFYFHPLRAYDGDASLFLTGSARYRPRPGRPRFDLVAQTSRFPIERVLDYLDLDLPVTGRLTGRLPFTGDAASLRGRGAFILEGGSVYGQPISTLSADAVFAPGRVAFENVRGNIGDAVVGGDLSYDVKDRRYEFLLAGDDVPIAKIEALGSARDSISGEISFHAEGSGALDRPSLTATLRTKDLAVFGEAVPDATAPQVQVSVSEGALDLQAGAPGRWAIEARGDLTRPAPQIAVDVRIDDLGAIAELAGFGGTMSGAVKANGILELDSRTREVDRAAFQVSTLKIDTKLPTGELSAASPIDVAFENGVVSIREARLVGASSDVRLEMTVDTRKDMALAGSLSGRLDPAFAVSLLVPNAESSGQITARLTLGGTVAKPSLQGALRLENGRFRSSISPYVLDGVSAEIGFAGSRGTVESLHAKIGGGDLYASGDFHLSGLGLRDFRLLAQLQDVTVRSIEGLRLQANADLTFSGDLEQAIVRGEATILSGNYSKDFSPTLASLFTRSRSAEFVAAAPSWQDRVRLEIHVVSSAGLEVRNNLARLTASMDLIARGTLADPVLIGQISIDEGGKITFQDVKYEIQSGTITFGNPQRTEPLFDIVATTEVRGYSINVQAVGSLGDRSRVQFHLSSDPPLSDEQVASLLLTGSAITPAGGPERPETGSASSVVGSIAGLAFRPVTSKVQEIFRLDRFQVDPILQRTPGSSGGAVITIGKNLSKDLSVTYSYSAETNAQSIVLVEYQIDANKVLQASKDENNVYSINIKLRKRF